MVLYRVTFVMTLDADGKEQEIVNAIRALLRTKNVTEGTVRSVTVTKVTEAYPSEAPCTTAREHVDRCVIGLDAMSRHVRYVANASGSWPLDRDTFTCRCGQTVVVGQSSVGVRCPRCDRTYTVHERPV